MDKRRAALDASARQNRSRVYEEVFRHVVESFGSTGRTLSEHEVRSRAATWASTGTLEALTDWFRYASRHSGTKPTEDIKFAERYELVYRVARSMRVDLELDDPEVSKNTLVSMIFSGYAPGIHDSPQVRGLTIDWSGDTVFPAATDEE